MAQRAARRRTGSAAARVRVPTARLRRARRAWPGTRAALSALRSTRRRRRWWRAPPAARSRCSTSRLPKARAPPRRGCALRPLTRRALAARQSCAPSPATAPPASPLTSTPTVRPAAALLPCALRVFLRQNARSACRVLNACLRAQASFSRRARWTRASRSGTCAAAGACRRSAATAAACPKSRSALTADGSSPAATMARSRRVTRAQLRVRTPPALTAAVRRQLWDLAAGKVLVEFAPHAAGVTAVECVPSIENMRSAQHRRCADVARDVAASTRMSSCWPLRRRTAPRACGTWKPGRWCPKVRAPCFCLLALRLHCS